MTSTNPVNTTASPAVEVHQVNLLYPDGQNPDGSPRTVAALDRVNFTAARGELTALVGASGSGKSSLLSVIGALVQPSSGTVQIDHLNIEKLTEAEQAELRRETVGLIFQQPNLLSALGVRDQLLITDHIRGLRGTALKHRTARADELLEVVGLQDMTDRKIHALSGGQRQRVNIARALMGTPQVLLADEPTSALDQPRSHEVMRLLKTLTQEFSVATIVVTHDRELAKYADEVVTLADGHVASVATSAPTPTSEGSGSSARHAVPK